MNVCVSLIATTHSAYVGYGMSGPALIPPTGKLNRDVSSVWRLTSPSSNPPSIQRVPGWASTEEEASYGGGWGRAASKIKEGRVES